LNDLRVVTEQIKSVLDLRDIIPDLTRKGNDYVRLCPFHNETEPSFFVRKEFYKCFSCGKGGDIFNWLQEQEGFDFMTALAVAAGQAGVKIDDNLQETIRKAETERSKIENAFSSYRKALGSNEEAMGYLLGRGLTEETIVHFCLGYCDERNAIAIPVLSKAGRIQTFAYRMMEGEDRYRIYNTEMWKKSDGLYNLAGLDNDGPIFVAEGFFDVMTIHQAGYPKVIGMMGNSLSEAHIQQLDGTSIVFVPDAKVDADFDIFKKALLRLRRIHGDLSVKVALLEDGDANSAGVEAVQAAIENAEIAEFAILKHDLDLCPDDERDEQYKIARKIGREITDEYIKDDVVEYLAKRWGKTKDVVRNGLYRSE
jgi:DNA primase